jgi:hypothetical protein
MPATIWSRRLSSSSSVSKNIKIETYATKILPHVLYGRGTWSLTSREERTSRLEGAREWVLRKIFRAKGGKVTGDWRKLHNKELYALYHSPNVIPVIK